MILQRRLALGVGLILALTASSVQAARRNHVRLVIAPVSGKKIPAMNSQIASLVGKPIEKSVTLVSYTSITRAATKAGVSTASLAENTGLAKAARAAGATHVLQLSVADGSDGLRGSAGPLAMRAALLEVASGDVIWSHRYTLIDQKLTGPVANQLIADVRKVLGVSSKGGRAAAPPYPSTTMAPPPLAVPPEAEGAANLPPDIGRNNASQAGMIAEAQKVADPSPTSQTAIAAPAPEPEDVAKRRRLRARPGLRVSLGEAIFTRAAFVNAGPNDHPPCYCLVAGKSPAVFARTQLHIELYPFSFDPYGDWWEGFGGSLDATIGTLKTGLPNGSVVSSTVGGFDLALMYRWVWPDPLSSYDTTFKLGYSKWSLPLQGAQFPGVGFNVLYAGLGASLGVLDWLDVLLDGGYRFRVVGFGGTSVLGAAQIASGHGYYLDAGARFKVWEGLELSALFYIDHYYAPFYGKTTLQNQTTTDLQYNDVTLTDSYVGALLSVGYRL